MQPDQGSAPDGQHAQPDVSLVWVEGGAEALPAQRHMYCSSQKRSIFFPVTFLKEPGWNTSARSLQALSRTFLASSKDLWLNRQNGNFYLEKEDLTNFQVSQCMPKKPLWSTCSQWDLFGTKQETRAGEWLAGQYKWMKQLWRDSYFSCLIYESKLDAQLSQIYFDTQMCNSPVPVTK